MAKKLIEVARDSKGQVMWIYGKPHLSPLTYREWREGKDMTSGTIRKSIYTFYAPFTTNMEEEDTDFIIRWNGVGLRSK